MATSRSLTDEGPWQLFRSPLRTLAASARPELDTATAYGEVAMPGNVQLQVGLADPFLDVPAVSAINDYEWLYVTSFPRPTESGQVFLVFVGADYFTNVWVNGTHAGSHEGAFDQWEIEITELIEDSNELILGISCPWYVDGRQNEVRDSSRAAPFHYTTEYLKGELVFFWDQLPLAGQAVLPFGMWGDISITVRREVELLRAAVSTVSITEDAAELRLHCEWWSAEVADRDVVLTAVVEPENFSDTTAAALPVHVTVAPGYNETSTTFTLKSPRLWWTWDTGDQNLYRLTIGGVKTVFGVRVFERDDETLVYSINGKRLFLRGVWYPFASMYSSEPTARQHRRDVDMLRDANINYAIVFTFVEKEQLYDACDRAGILLFQEMPFSQFGPLKAVDPSYPRYSEYRAATLSQIERIVRQRRGHASLVLWAAWAETRKAGEWEFGDYSDFNDAIEAIVSEQDPDTIYHPSLCDFGEEHFWEGGFAHGEFEDHYDKNALHVSEFGAIAPPVTETMEEMLSAQALWGTPPEASGRLALPIDAEEWAFRWSFNYAGLCNSVARVYRTVHRGPESIQCLLDAMQWYQAYGLRFCAEAYRRKRFAMITGCRTWSYRQVLPGISFTVVDHRQRPKIGYFGLKAGYEPLLLSVDDPAPLRSRASGGTYRHDLWVVNDYHQDLPLDLVVRLLDLGGGEIWRLQNSIEAQADSGSVAATIEFPLPEPGAYLLRCEASGEGAKTVAETWVRVARPAFGQQPLRVLLLGQSRFNAPILQALDLVRGIELTVLDEATLDPRDDSWAEDLPRSIDVVWFSGWESAAHRLSPSVWTALSEAVKGGVGLVHTGGQGCFHGGDGRGALLDCTPLGELLPVTLQPHDIVWHPAGNVQTASAADRDFFGALERGPVLPFSRTTARNDAEIHAWIDGFPLLVTGRAGVGRVAVFTGSFTKPIAVLPMIRLGQPEPPEILPYWERDNLKDEAMHYWSGLVQLAIALLARASGRATVASPAELADEHQRPLFEELANLPITTLGCTVEAPADERHTRVATVTNTGATIARLVRGRVITSTTNDHRFLDGFFDLLPGEQRTLRFEADCADDQLVVEISAQNAAATRGVVALNAALST